MDPPTPRRLDRRTCLAGLASVAGVLSGCRSDDARDATVASTARSDAATSRTADVDRTSTVPDSDTTRSTTRTTAPSTTAVFPGYRTTDVTVRSPDGTTRGSVTAAVADTPGLRYTGLSDTPSLPDDRGMLFVFESAGSRTFVMRGMAYGLDIVFADADRTITRIHHASAPGPGEDGADQRYPGTGQYVLEVNLGWTTGRGVSTGDVLAFEYLEPKGHNSTTADKSLFSMAIWYVGCKDMLLRL